MKYKVALLALEDSPRHRVFTSALLRSLAVFARDEKGFGITIIGKHSPQSEIPIELISPEVVCGVSAFPAELPLWYCEQIAALFFAAKCGAEYSLILPTGAFATAKIGKGTLFPEGKARTTWEDRGFHQDWWENAAKITKRFACSPYAGPSVLPGILNSELARWTIDIVDREFRGDAFDALADAALSGMSWSAMSLYMTACGSRFLQSHHDAFASREYALMKKYQLWSNEQLRTFKPGNGGIDDAGLFTYVHVNGIDRVDEVIERLETCLKPDHKITSMIR